MIDSIHRRELIVPRQQNAFEEGQSHRRVERISAAFGSWRFFALILLALAGWVLVNVLLRPFEPYPTIIFAVTGAVLASLAALQGPIILMNQGRQRMADRMIVEQDYEVNLKAELELRYLQESIEQLHARLEK